MRLATLGEQVAGLSLFAKCDTAFHRAVVLAMTQHLYPHRSTLLDGTSPEGLYLVKNGTVIMASTGSDAIQVMHAGQYFGAEVLLGNGQACTVEVIYGFAGISLCLCD